MQGVKDRSWRILESVRWPQNLWLGLILALATGTRLFGLTFQSLRFDEHFSRSTSSIHSLLEAIHRGAVADLHPPGYCVFLHFIIEAFGDAEWTIRFPSAIAGVLGVYFVYRLGRELFSARIGLTSAALCAVAEQPVQFSQDARAYSLMMLGSTVCTLLAVRIQRSQASPSRTRMLVMFVLAATATSYLHYFGLLMVFLLGLFQLMSVVRKRLSLRIWLVAYLVPTLLYTPWLSFMFEHAQRTRSWMRPPLSHKVLAGVTLQLTGHATWLVLAILAAGTWVYFARYRSTLACEHAHTWDFTLLALVGWVLTPLVAGALISQVTPPVLSGRNMIIAEPAVLIFSGWALTVLDASFPKGRGLVSIGVVAVFFVHLVFVRHYYTKPRYPAFRDVAEFIARQANSEAKPPFVIAPRGWAIYLDYYWNRREIVGKLHRYDLKITASERNLKRKVAALHPDMAFLIDDSRDGRARFPRSLPGYHLANQQHFFRVDVLEFSRSPRPPSK